MPTEAQRLYSTYMQSHGERYEKLREESYKEFIAGNKTAQEYRDELAAREKAYIRGIEALRKAQGAGLTSLDMIRLEKEIASLKIEAQEEARRQRLDIEKNLGKELTVPEAAQRKLDERGEALATAGALITDSPGLKAFMDASIGEVAATVSGGTRSAASTAQSLYKQLSNSPQFSKLLTTTDREALRQKIEDSFGLAQVNIGGISGQFLLDEAQDVLLQREIDDLLAKEGKAYGISRLTELENKLKDLQDPEKQKDAKAASAEELKPLEDKLKEIQDALREAPKPEFPSEAAVRQRADEKYGFEAAKFLRSQFERDMLGTDQDKLLHYDAIQAAKSSPYSSSDDVYKAAKMYSDNLKPVIGTSKADRRKAILEKAAEYGAGFGGDTNKRDEFLIAFHQVELEKARGRTGESEVLPQPQPPAELLKAPPAAPIPDTGRVDFERRPAELEPRPGGRELARAEQAALMGASAPDTRPLPTASEYYKLNLPSLADLFRNDIEPGERKERFKNFATKYLTPVEEAALMGGVSPDVFDLVSGTLKRRPTDAELLQAEILKRAATLTPEAFDELIKENARKRAEEEMKTKVQEGRTE